jgi:hypothetical protein
MAATGTAKLEGAALQSAKMVLVIPSRSAIPLGADGTDVGNVDGRIEISELTSDGGKTMGSAGTDAPNRHERCTGIAGNGQHRRQHFLES